MGAKIVQTTTKITFVGFLLAVSTLSVSSAKASPKIQDNINPSGNIEYRLSRITKAIEQRNIETSDSLNIESREEENIITRGFANRGGGGGFANTGGGGFTNRSGGGGFANRGGGGGFANTGGGGGFVNRSPWRNGGSFFNR